MNEPDGTVGDGFRRYALPVCTAVILLDQLVKALVAAAIPLHGRVPLWPGLLAVTHVHNRGMAFGIFSDVDGGWLRWALAAVAVAAVYVIWSYARHEGHRPAVLVAFGAILGGALGNLIDRIRFGYVVDFVLAHWGRHEFPAFNVADSAITMGGVLRATSGPILNEGCQPCFRSCSSCRSPASAP